MGSRAVAVIARDAAVAARRFGVQDGSSGVVYTRTGRPFFADTTELVDRVRAAVDPLFGQLQTDWLALDGELLPWTVKAMDLVVGQYASVGAAAREAVPAALDLLERASGRGLDVAQLTQLMRRRQHAAAAFRDAYTAYVHPTDGLDGVTLAPFQILAGEGEAYAVTRPHLWHLDRLGSLDHPLITPTRRRVVDLASAADRADAAAWWDDLTATGGEGMVVKPADGAPSRIQPGVKVRGREYLRIIYGPDYPEHLDVLRRRHLGRKRSMARREHGLGWDALEAFVDGRPLWTVHQLVFAVLALESQPVDPRL